MVCAGTTRRIGTRTYIRIRNGIPTWATGLTLAVIPVLVLAQVLALGRLCVLRTTIVFIRIMYDVLYEYDYDCGCP